MTLAVAVERSDKASTAAESANSIRQRQELGWRPALFLLAGAAVLHALATWDWDGRITPSNQMLRLYSLPVVWIELIVLWWATRLGWRPARHFSKLPLFAKWLCAALCVSVSITTIFASEAPAISALFGIRYVLHIFLISSLIFLISKDADFSFGYWTLVLCGGIALYVASLIIFCLFLTDPQIFRWVERIPSGTNIRQIGNVLGLLALVPATLLIFDRSDIKATMAAFLLTVIMTFIMWSGTRGALLGFGLAIGFAGWQSRKALKLSRFVILALLCLLALAISLYFPAPAPEFGMIRIAESFSSGDSASGRFQMWQTTIEAIKHAPFFGYGAGTFRENMAWAWVLNYPYNHPHNFILQFAYDWGIVGGGLALTLLALAGFSIISSKKGKPEELFLASSGFVALIAMALIEGTLFHPLPIIMAIALIAPHLAHYDERH